MKKAVILALSLILGVTAQANQLAFPGAEGAGKWALGGRGGVVYEVNSLADYNDVEAPMPGTLRAAVEASGPRTVVFRVSGNIELCRHLRPRNSFLTIAGQTAPGDGICIWRYPLTVVDACDVVIRYIRSRTTDEAYADPGFVAEGMDALGAESGHRIIFDHCSASWSVDESLSTSVQPGFNYLFDVTVQWCMISEALDCSVHNSPACHGYGTLAKGGYGANYTYHHNLYAHNKGRNPYPGNYVIYTTDPCGLTFDFRNNLIYNWTGPYAGYDTQASPAHSIVKMNFVGNYYKPGLDSTIDDIFYMGPNLEECRGYFSANWFNGSYPSDPWSVLRWGTGWTSGEIAAFKLAESTSVNEPIPPEDAETAYQRVLAGAGATLPARDIVDQNVITDVINGTGHKINDETEAGGLVPLYSTTPPEDNDHDGMPNEWEIPRGLDPNNANDGATDKDSDEYTNLEEYLNYLVIRNATTADFDGDDDVDWQDLEAFLNDWLVEDDVYVPVGDLYGGDHFVDWRDFAVFAASWTGP
jgi:hypothetical protein